MATNSPRRIDPLQLTSCLRNVGSVLSGKNTQAPAPHGPGFPKHEPSVKATAVSRSHGSNSPSIISLDSISCSPDLDLDDPKQFQYSGLDLDGCKDSWYANSFSRL